MCTKLFFFTFDLNMSTPANKHLEAQHNQRNDDNRLSSQVGANGGFYSLNENTSGFARFSPLTVIIFVLQCF